MRAAGRQHPTTSFFLAGHKALDFASLFQPAWALFFFCRHLDFSLCRFISFSFIFFSLPEQSAGVGRGRGRLAHPAGGRVTGEAGGPGCHSSRRSGRGTAAEAARWVEGGAGYCRLRAGLACESRPRRRRRLELASAGRQAGGRAGAGEERRGTDPARRTGGRGGKPACRVAGGPGAERPGRGGAGREGDWRRGPDPSRHGARRRAGVARSWCAWTRGRRRRRHARAGREPAWSRGRPEHRREAWRSFEPAAAAESRGRRADGAAGWNGANRCGRWDAAWLVESSSGQGPAGGAAVCLSGCNHGCMVEEADEGRRQVAPWPRLIWLQRPWPAAEETMQDLGGAHRPGGAEQVYWWHPCFIWPMHRQAMARLV